MDDVGIQVKWPDGWMWVMTSDGDDIDRMSRVRAESLLKEWQEYFNFDVDVYTHYRLVDNPYGGKNVIEVTDEDILRMPLVVIDLS